MRILADYTERRDNPDMPLQFPDELLDADHAHRIHGQTLQRLNERGGLCVEEIVLNVNRLPYSEYKNMDFKECLQQVREWIKNNQTTAVQESSTKSVANLKSE
jgi:hypothetical protein